MLKKIGDFCFTFIIEFGWVVYLFGLLVVWFCVKMTIIAIKDLF